MKFLLGAKDRASAFFGLFFPRCCVVCGKPLAKGEDCICIMCGINLPRTDYHLRKDNPMEQLFWGKLPLERGTSFFFYRKGCDYRHILHQLKYKGEKEIGVVMGRNVAAELLASGFFEGIDLIIPVPLHPKRKKERGYNQSEWFAKGISVATGIPMNTESVVRQEHTETQTRKSVFERWENVDGIFLVNSDETLAGKHVLIVDDVLTTGSTITSCASCLNGIKGLRISVLTLAVAE